jgi:hypothetical protein
LRSAVLPPAKRLPCHRVNRGVHRTRPLATRWWLDARKQSWTPRGNQWRRVRNHHDPDQSSLGDRDKTVAGTDRHPKGGVNEGRQPHRRLATPWRTVRPDNRPRLRRAQPRLPIWRVQPRIRATKALGLTLNQHIKARVITTHDTCRRGPGGISTNKRHGHHHRRQHGRVGSADKPRHGESMRHFATCDEARSGS